MTLAQLQQMSYDELIAVCLTDPQHVAYAEHMPLMQLVSLISADEQHPEGSDTSLKSQLEEAGFGGGGMF